MKITIIHGQNHKGSTYHVAKMLADQLEGEVTEFFLPRDFGEYCVGCSSCFKTAENLCPHYEKLQPITKALDEADVIILDSPVYVYHVTGSMKSFLDHYGYRWMVHRPEETMFRKVGVCISTAAGGGMKSTNKDMKDSLYYWGVGKIYQLGFPVAAINWNGVKPEKKAEIEKQTQRLAKKIRKVQPKVKPGIKTKAFFGLMRMLQKKDWNAPDVAYWKEKGWDGTKRPWK